MKKTQRTVKREDAGQFKSALKEFDDALRGVKTEAEQLSEVLQIAREKGFFILIDDANTGTYYARQLQKYLAHRLVDASTVYFNDLVPLIHGVSIPEQDKVRAALCKACNVLSVEEVDKIVALLDAVRKNLESVVIEEGEEQ